MDSRDDLRTGERAGTGKPRFLVVDFFCGAGGTTSGLISAGCHVLAGIDRDAACERTYVLNNVNRTGDGAPARYLNLDVFPPSADHPDGQGDVLVGELDAMVGEARRRMPGVPLMFAICAPCQPFTNLARNRLSDDRSEARARDRSLLLETLRFVERFRPDAILSENVAGIGEARYGGVWEAFLDGLAGLGYATGHAEVDASRFGVPQTRVRRILAAILRPEAPGPGLDLPLSDGTGAVATVASAIGHLPPIAAGETHPSVPDHRASKLSEVNLRRIARARPGESNLTLSEGDEDLSLECHRKARETGDRGSFSHVYTRLSGDRPAPTLTTKFTSISNGRYGHYDMAQDRGLSVREGAILQSFGDGYVFHHPSIIAQARMVGNAVPPKLAGFFGSWLADIVSPREMEVA